jgi:hypothetical protein
MCADCGRDVTDQPSHECKEQRKANRKYAKAREAMFAGKDWKPLLPKKEVR